MSWITKGLGPLLRRIPSHYLRWGSFLLGGLTVVNILVPDLLPFVDEAVMIWIWTEVARERRGRLVRRQRVIDVDDLPRS